MTTLFHNFVNPGTDRITNTKFSRITVTYNRDTGVQGKIPEQQIIEKRANVIIEGKSVASNALMCVEHGVWTPVPDPPPSAPEKFILKLREVDIAERDRIKKSGAMSFHLTGCTGDYENHAPQTAVAQAMIDQCGGKSDADPAPSFFYHLGDITYKPDAEVDPHTGDTLSTSGEDRPGEDYEQRWKDQFYTPYAKYPRPIFAVAGNHDGKQAAIPHFMRHFCPETNPTKQDNHQNRPNVAQPYIYWRLNTPIADFLGLYTNVANGGILDDPHDPDTPQYNWLVNQLTDIKRRNAAKKRPKALLLMLHYPPYSGASNFAERGNPRLGPTEAIAAEPIGNLLQKAFKQAGVRPDAVFSAHAHLYQRLTYTYADGRQIPYLVAGSGGHTVEKLLKKCNGETAGAEPERHFKAVLPPKAVLKGGDTVRVHAVNDEHFGFLRVTIRPGKLTGEFYTAYPDPVRSVDKFELDLLSHRMR